MRFLVGLAHAAGCRAAAMPSALPPLPAGGKVGLIDYGQSKQLPDEARIAFAKLIVALDKEDKPVSLLFRVEALLSISCCHFGMHIERLLHRQVHRLWDNDSASFTALRVIIKRAQDR